MIEAGRKFPAFELCDDEGRSVTLKQLAGKPFVVFVYPKASTPG